MRWSVIPGSDDRKHLVPVEDMRPHRHSIDCWCRPTPSGLDPTLMVHNAMDERERFEGRAQ